jgi:6-phosphogluconolactonase
MHKKSLTISGTEISRRHLMIAGAASVAGVLSSTVFAQGGELESFVYVGSYTKDPPGGGSENPEGLSVFKFDPKTGALSLVQQVKSANPSFVALHPSQRYLYAVNEVDDFDNKKQGSVEAYAIDGGTGKLTLLNRQSSGGTIPAHLTVTPDGGHVIVANYMGGNFTALPINADGKLEAQSGEIKESGNGPDKERQEGPHPHMVVVTPGGGFIAAADLGIDKIKTFRVNKGALEPVSEASVAPGAGPRHIAFSKDGRFLYVVTEMKPSVVAFAFDQKTGEIGKQLQTISTEPAGYNGPHSTAEIAVHPTGKYLYASNRGHNSIVSYRIDPQSGELTLLGFATQGVNFPRNFAIDPSGDRLYVANQKADDIVPFTINIATGELTPAGQPIASITPVAMVFRTAS